MESRGWRRDRTRAGRIDSLITLPIARIDVARPMNIGGEWRLPQLYQVIHKITFVLEHQSVPALSHLTDDFCREPVRKKDPAAQVRFLPPIHQGNPEVRPIRGRFQKKHFHPSPTLFLSSQTGRQNPGVVQYQQLPGAQEFAQGRKIAVEEFSRIPPHYHEASFLPLLTRIGRDQRSGQLIHELFQFHEGDG